MNLRRATIGAWPACWRTFGLDRRFFGCSGNRQMHQDAQRAVHLIPHAAAAGTPASSRYVNDRAYVLQEASLQLQWASTSVDPDAPGTPVFTAIPGDYLGSTSNPTPANVTLPDDPVAGCCMAPGDPACTAPPPQSPSPDPPMPSPCGQVRGRFSVSAHCKSN